MSYRDKTGKIGVGDYAISLLRRTLKSLIQPFTENFFYLEKPAMQQPVFTMTWDQAAKDMFEMVPAEFLAKAVEGTENHARENKYGQITAAIVEEYREKLGF